MRFICNLCSSLFPSLEGGGSQRERELGIDASTRFATLGTIKASVFWLLVASLLGLISSIKLHSPSYLAEFSCLSYGKVYPAFWNVLVYGWLFNAGLACVCWISARLAGRPIGNSYLLTIAGGAWNFAVIVGLVGILVGDQRPFRLLEFPSYAAPLLFVSFLGMGIWILLAFKARAYRSTFVSQWYVLAAVFSFVWIYMIAQVMIFLVPAQGVFQSVVASWFFGNLSGLVIAPLAFATLYYLIPKTLGQHIVGYRQSGIAFWTWLAASSCSGLAALVNGPFPAWVASVGVIASFALFLPVSIFGMQFVSSLLSSFSKIWDSLSARFVAYSVVAFLVASLLIVFGSLRGPQETLQFTQFENGLRFLFLAGFGGMAFMGGSYFILPRLLNKELPSSGLIDVQFWIQGLGIFVIAASLISAGSAHGALLNGSEVDTVQALASVQPYFFIATLGFVFFLSGSLMYAVSFFWMLLSSRSEKEKSAELLKSAPELEYTPS